MESSDFNENDRRWYCACNMHCQVHFALFYSLIGCLQEGTYIIGVVTIVLGALSVIFGTASMVLGSSAGAGSLISGQTDSFTPFYRSKAHFSFRHYSVRC